MFNKAKISSGAVMKTIIILWIIFSIAYVGYDVWSDFKAGLLNQTYQAGRADTINQLITQSENKECQPFSVYSDQKQVQVINVTCLTAPKAQAEPKADASVPVEENK